jgi:hypothetical protein
MLMSYLPDQMLRNLAPQRLTQTQQRELDEQLGTVVAAITRGTGGFTGRLHAWGRQTTRAGQAVGSFRKPADESASPRACSACP